MCTIALDGIPTWLSAVAVVGVAIFSCGFISTTVSMTYVFRHLRAFLLARNGWLGRLASCPYCLGTWLAAAYVAAGAAFDVLPLLPWWGYFLAWTGLAGASALVSGWLCSAMHCMMDLAERPSLLE